jgi:hypothetical protein
MSRHDVAVLTLRAFALYAWFQAFEFFAGGTLHFYAAITILQASGVTFKIVLTVLSPTLIYLLVGLFLFFRSRELASWLLPPPSKAQNDAIAPHPLEIASIAFAVIGVAFSLHALPALIQFGMSFYVEREPHLTLRDLWSALPYILSSLAQFVLGLLLFLKALTFATVWWRKQQPKISQ